MYGFPNVCYSFEAARTLTSKAQLDHRELILFELGLHKTHMDRFGSKAEPPPSPPGFAPIGEQGVYTATQRQTEVSAEGVLLGFEPLVFESSLNCSWLCNSLVDEVAANVGVRPNRHGFIESFVDANRVVEYISQEHVGAEPGLWLPWLLIGSSNV